VKYKQRLFIYERREMFILVPLVLMVSLFTFTLGIHWGKRVASRVPEGSNESTPKVATVQDHVPDRVEFTEQAKGEDQAVVDNLNQELKNEVVTSGIKLDLPRQITLPEHTKSSHGGATSLNSSEPKKLSISDKKGLRSPASKIEDQGSYSLQIGSYPTLDEVKKQLGLMNSSEQKPFWREVEIKGKGKWYRLYFGKFSSRNAAEQAGEKYRSQHMISSFIVSKILE
jgi:cell division septation protein DedD